MILAMGVLLNSTPVSASEAEPSLIIDGIIESKLQALSLDSEQELIEALVNDLDSSASPWYLIGLSRLLPEELFSSALDVLDSYVSKKEKLSTADRLKLSLLYSALTNGDENEFVRTSLELDVESGGVTNRIYLLLLLDSGDYQSTRYSRKELTSLLLSEQKADGGWALSGSVSDADTTAMAVQALAPYLHSDKEVKPALESALALLSAKQNPTGDFSSWGTKNCESVAQVICALCALELDPFTDQRFVKDGTTLLDGLLNFRLSDGSFAHTEGGKSNDIATSQALYALIAVQLQREGKPFLFRFNEKSHSDLTSKDPSASPESELSAETQTEAEPESQSSSGEAPLASSKEDSVSKTKIFVCIAITAVFLILGILLYLKGKRKLLVPLLVTGLLLCFAVLFIEIESVDEHYEKNSDSITEGAPTVFFSINASQALGLSQSIPQDAWVLKETELLLKDGETVFDLLCRAARLFKLQLEHSGGSYIKGINHLYEFDCGEASGWTYKVNGLSTSLACCDFVLKDGDKVEWIYVLEPERNVFTE